MNPEEVEAQFGILRDLTKRTELLSEIQEKQLQGYLSAVLRRKGEVVFSPQDRAVLFDIEDDMPTEAEMEYATFCTRWLLGNDINVGVRACNDSWVAPSHIG